MDDAALQAYYERDKERDRLDGGLGRVEFERTVDIISRTLPVAPSIIADIGGGPGRYTDFFVEQGYTVIHRDVVPHHVDQVRANHGDHVDSALGDARALDLADASVEAVLLLGPLYHLPKADRAQAIAEASRVTKPGGMIYAAAIGTWAVRNAMFLVDRVHVEMPEIIPTILEVDSTGVITPVIDAGFTGYTHSATELHAEISAEASLDVEDVFAIEGVASMFTDAMVDERLATEADRQIFYETLRAQETEPDLAGVSAHLLAVASRI